MTVNICCGSCKFSHLHLTSTNQFPVDTRAAAFRVNPSRVICTEDPLTPVVLYDAQSPCDRYQLRSDDD